MPIDTFTTGNYGVASHYGAYINSVDTTYSKAALGTGATLSFNTNTISVGNAKSGSNYLVREIFLSFDTSSLPNSIIVNSATLQGYYLAGVSVDTAFDINARIYDWGTTITTADFRTPTQLATYPLIAHYTVPSGNGAGSFTFTSDSGFLTNISTTGRTSIVVHAVNHMNMVTPTDIQTKSMSSYNASFGDQVFVLTVDYTPVTTVSVTGSLSGSLSGSIAKKVNKYFSGSPDSLTGSILTGIQYIKSLSGDIATVSGSIVRKTIKSLSGGISPNGIVTKRITKSFSGSMGALTGSLSSVRAYLKTISGTVGSLTGSLTSRQNGFGKSLSGSITASGSVSRRVGKALIGTFGTLRGNVGFLATIRFAIMRSGRTVIKRIGGGSG